MFQNSSISSSSSKAFLKGFVVATGVLMLIGTGLGLYLGPPSGDLMRIGRMASIDWQPLQAQDPLVVVANPPGPAPDVLVLGDSFSAANAWQSELSGLQALRVETWHYNDVGCLDAWLRAAIADQGPRAGSVIIVQSIEREALARFGNPARKCLRTQGKPIPVPAATLYSDQVPGLFPIDLRYLTGAARHHFRPSSHHGHHVSRSAATVDLTDGNLFSNRIASRLAYFHGDEGEWRDRSAATQQAAIDYLAELQALAASQGKRLLVVIIPNKSTVYAPWVAAGQLPATPEPGLFPALAERLGAESNLLSAFQQEARRQRDLYRPDDTHLSLNGYRFLAREVQRRMLAQTAQQEIVTRAPVPPVPAMPSPERKKN